MSVSTPKFRYPAVMLIDDNEIDNFINLKMLENTFFSERIFVHTNGKSALEFLQNLVRQGQKDEILFPEIIFLDLNMPVMDGYQFADEFEKIQNSFIERTKIVVLTTSLNLQDVEKSKKYSRIIKYINKPLTKLSLESIVDPINMVTGDSARPAYLP